MRGEGGSLAPSDPAFALPVGTGGTTNFCVTPVPEDAGGGGGATLFQLVLLYFKQNRRLSLAYVEFVLTVRLFAL